MKEVIFYDSGIGGIALLNKMRERCKRENFVYFADNANLPYGKRDSKEILELVASNLEREVKTTTKCVIIACNTITSQSISQLRKVFPETKIFGIEPEIKCVEKHKLKNTLLIATPQTCEAVKSKVEKYMSENNIIIHPARSLAKIIESQINNKEEIYKEIKKIKRAHSEKFQGVILGCTHYALVKDVFMYAFPDNTKIFDGVKGTIANVSRNIIKERTGFGSLRLVLTKEDMQEKLKYASLIH